MVPEHTVMVCDRAGFYADYNGWGGHVRLRAQ